MRIGNLGKMLAYACSIRRAYEESGVEAPGHEIPLPGLADAESQVAVPAIVLGQLVAVLVIESPQRLAFTTDDEALLTIVATMVASAIEIDWAQERTEENVDAPPPSAPRTSGPAEAVTTRVRFFAVDGSTFLDGDYLIKGVAGRILWALLTQHARGRSRRLHEQGGPARSDARAAGVPRQPREPAHPVEAAPRRTRRADPHREDRAGPVPPLRRDWTRARSGLVRSAAMTDTTSEQPSPSRATST